MLLGLWQNLQQPRLYRRAIHYANRSLKTGEELEIGDRSPSSIIGNALYHQGLFEESILYFTKVLVRSRPGIAQAHGRFQGC